MVMYQNQILRKQNEELRDRCQINKYSVIIYEFDNFDIKNFLFINFIQIY